MIGHTLPLHRLDSGRFGPMQRGCSTKSHSPAFSANLTPLENITENHINETFDLLGPVPRLCIDFSSDELEEYKQAVNAALLEITVKTIEKLIKDTSTLFMDKVSHRICLLSWGQRDNVHIPAAVALISPSIHSRLSARFRNLHRDEQIHLYKYFERVSESRKVATSNRIFRMGETCYSFRW